MTNTIGASVDGSDIGGSVIGLAHVQARDINIQLGERKQRIGRPAPQSRAPAFVDRGKIMDDLRAAIRSGRAASIVGVRGMGGVGKTELAIHLCDEIEKEFPGRVIWVDTNDRLFDAQQSIASAVALDLRDESDRGRRADLLRSAVREHDIRLIVLDNVFRELAADLDYCKPSPPCALLVTSRYELPLPGGMFPLDVMTPAEALALLRGEPELASFVESQHAEADHICALCARHPLALRLAASRLRKHLRRSAPLKEFTVKLEDLAVRGREGDPAYNLKANFDLSYDDLPAADRVRWRKLAVFASTGFTAGAAAAVWGDSLTAATETLDRLLDASVTQIANGRYSLHDLLHVYAANKLREADLTPGPSPEGEGSAARRALAEWVKGFFEANNYDFANIRHNSPVALETDNLILAIEGADEAQDGNLMAALINAASNWMVYVIDPSQAKRAVWLTAALSYGIEDRNLRANVLKAIGDVQQFRKEMDAALKSYGEALSLFRAVGDKLGEANVLKAIGDVQQFRKEMDAALKSYGEALSLFRAVGDKLGEAN
ncbi:MAG: tetratricopeptide repeat protein, partial [Chloroflexi bacterium]|nr:tetratricopeptide repeat protein [Chloroflexota bacterium]